MNDMFDTKRKNFPEDIPKDMLEYTFCGAYRNVDFSGYESPIQVFEKDLGVKVTQEIEHTVFRKVLMLGVEIDKDGLMRALEYDRNQYAEGYYQGYRAGVESAQKKWISVEERLPDEGVKVLTLDRYGHVQDRFLYAFQDGPIVFRPDGMFPKKHVTHWMPMPESPNDNGRD